MQKQYLKLILLPLSFLYLIIVFCRKKIYKNIYYKKYPVPIVIVGNIVCGGTGKTPIVIAIIKLLISHGYKPAVVIRGYKSSKEKTTYLAHRDDSAESIGDEAKLLVNNLCCPILIGKNRRKSVNYIINNSLADIIVLDDGLQHYQLARDIEILVDTVSKSNQYLLPAGLLREPIARKKQVDFILTRRYQIKYFVKLVNNKKYNIIDFINYLKNNKNLEILASCAIGDPDNFFQLLLQLGMNIDINNKLIYKDHYKYKISDLNKYHNKIIIMTEKDAVKCYNFGLDNIFFLKVEAVLADNFKLNFINLVKAIQNDKRKSIRNTSMSSV